MAAGHWDSAGKGERRGEGFLANMTEREFAWVQSQRASWRGNFKRLRRVAGEGLQPVYGKVK